MAPGVLKEKTKKILTIAAVIANLCLTPGILLGAWLAYQGVLEFFRP